MGTQISLTDELYERDIEIAKFYNQLFDIERKIHFTRTTVSAAKLQYQSSDDIYYALEELKKDLTSMLDWISDLMFYMGGESEDVETKPQSQYKVLRDLDNPTSRDERVRLEVVSQDVLKVRQDLLRLSGEYFEYIDQVIPCMQIFEILYEATREAVRKTEKINYYSYE